MHIVFRLMKIEVNGECLGGSDRRKLAGKTANWRYFQVRKIQR